MLLSPPLYTTTFSLFIFTFSFFYTIMIFSLYTLFFSFQFPYSGSIPLYSSLSSFLIPVLYHFLLFSYKITFFFFFTVTTSCLFISSFSLLQLLCSINFLFVSSFLVQVGIFLFFVGDLPSNCFSFVLQYNINNLSEIIWYNFNLTYTTCSYDEFFTIICTVSTSFLI